MKILVLNGSPKGPTSVTMQYIAYWQKRFPAFEFTVVHVAQQQRLFEKNRAAVDTVMNKVAAADFVLWAFPLYFLLVHSGYMCFFELIFERGKEALFKDKYSAALSTSIHFYDHTAHNYIHSLSDDLGMNYLGGIPAHMNDLTKSDVRRSLDAVFSNWMEAAAHKLPTTPAFAPVRYTPNKLEDLDTAEEVAALDTGKKVCIVADLPSENSNLGEMVRLLRRYFPHAEMVNLAKLSMGPCRGCLKCGFDNRCVYGHRDEHYQHYRSKVLPADILIFAGTLRHRYLSSRWQRYLERSFVRTHQPVLKNKQVAFLISGPLSQNYTAREVLTAYTETMGGNLVSIISDEVHSPVELRRIIEHTARTLASFSNGKVQAPHSFLGVAGMKIFRDEIYTGLRFVFQADDRFYRQEGLYDFPHKRKLFRIAISLMILMSRIPLLRRKIPTKMKPMMLRPYKDIIARAKPMADTIT